MTRTAWGLLVAAPVLGAAGWLLEYQLLVGLGLAALIVVALGVAWAIRPMAPTVARIIRQPRVVVGAANHEVLRVTNPSGRRSGRVVIRERIDGEDRAVPVPRLAAGASHDHALVLPTDRRAVVDVGPTTIERWDPLGLVVRRRAVPGSSRTWVHPRTHRLSRLPEGQTHDRDSTSREVRAQGDTGFGGIREYVIGDDRRQIHWRSTARTGTLMVREPVATSEPALTVVLDARRRAHPEATFDLAIEIAASIVLSAAQQQVPNRLLRTGDDRTLSIGPDARHTPTDLLDALAAVDVDDAEDLTDVLERATARDRMGALVVVSGVIDSRDADAIRRAHRAVGRCTLIEARTGDTVSWTMIPGVRTLSATSGSEFVHVWNRSVHE